MTTHLFGGVWSPSCANLALKRTAEENIENYDIETIRTIDRNFYVDDCLKSMPTEHQAIRLVEQLRSVLSTRGFRLTKFLSNSKKVLKTLPTLKGQKQLLHGIWMTQSFLLKEHLEFCGIPKVTFLPLTQASRTIHAPNEVC